MIRRKTRTNYSIVRRSKSKGVAVERKMLDPKCPSCGHAMWLSRTISGDHPAQEQHVFQYSYCKVTYMTDDHTGVNGQHASG